MMCIALSSKKVEVLYIHSKIFRKYAKYDFANVANLLKTPILILLPLIFVISLTGDCTHVTLPDF